MKKQYLIRRKHDGRIIAGIFMPLTTRKMAENIRNRWRENFPSEVFTIETK